MWQSCNYGTWVEIQSIYHRNICIVSLSTNARPKLMFQSCLQYLEIRRPWMSEVEKLSHWLAASLSTDSLFLILLFHWNLVFTKKQKKGITRFHGWTFGGKESYIMLLYLQTNSHDFKVEGGSKDSIGEGGHQGSNRNEKALWTYYILGNDSEH